VELRRTDYGVGLMDRQAPARYVRAKKQARFREEPGLLFFK
jgi:hypothetical protein